MKILIAVLIACLSWVGLALANPQGLVGGVIRGSGGGGATAGFVGNNTTSTVAANSSSANEGQYGLYTSTAAGTIGYCHAEIADGDTKHFNIALYDASFSKLAESNLTTASGSPAVVNFALDSPVTITNSTNYYIFSGSSDDTFWRVRIFSGGSYQYDVPTTIGDAMLTPMSTGGTTGSGYTLRMWCDNSPTG